MFKYRLNNISRIPLHRVHNLLDNIFDMDRYKISSYNNSVTQFSFDVYPFEFYCPASALYAMLCFKMFRESSSIFALMLIIGWNNCARLQEEGTANISSYEQLLETYYEVTDDHNNITVLYRNATVRYSTSSLYHEDVIKMTKINCADCYRNFILIVEEPCTLQRW